MACSKRNPRGPAQVPCLSRVVYRDGNRRWSELFSGGDDEVDLDPHLHPVAGLSCDQATVSISEKDRLSLFPLNHPWIHSQTALICIGSPSGVYSEVVSSETILFPRILCVGEKLEGGPWMSHGSGPCNLTQRRVRTCRWVFQWLALTASLAAAPILAHSQTLSIPRPESTSAVLAPGLVNGSALPELSTPSIKSLILESDQVGAAMHARLPEYTYVQTRITRDPGPKGRIVEHTNAYEAYPVSVLGRHRHIISLIREDGAPLSPKRLQKERQQAALAIEAAERENAQRRVEGTSGFAEKYITAGIGLGRNGEGVWVGVSQFLRQCRFSEPRREMMAGREMIALKIESCSADFDGPREKYLSQMTGVIWIDAAEKAVARLEAWPVVQPEATQAETLVYEQMRLQCGLWVPRRIRLNALGKGALFNGTDNDMTFEFSQYLQFGAEVKELQQAILKPKS